MGNSNCIFPPCVFPCDSVDQLNDLKIFRIDRYDKPTCCQSCFKLCFPHRSLNCTSKQFEELVKKHLKENNISEEHVHAEKFELFRVNFYKLTDVKIVHVNGKK
jgi:hypothetical protein